VQCFADIFYHANKTYVGSVVRRNCPSGQVAVGNDIRRESLPPGMVTFAYIQSAVDCVKVPEGLTLKVGDRVILTVNEHRAIEILGKHIPVPDEKP
jgi:hypothetical protein